MELERLPGGDLVEQGLQDLASRLESVPSLLVCVGAPRLRDLGIPIPDDVFPSPEHRLYALLCEEDSDSAHSRYNALVRKLVSFERARACARPQVSS